MLKSPILKRIIRELDVQEEVIKFDKFCRAEKGKSYRQFQHCLLLLFLNLYL